MIRWTVERGLPPSSTLGSSRVCRTILTAYSDDALSWYHLGLARESLGDAEGAQNAWKAALEADPSHEPSRTALGR